MGYDRGGYTPDRAAPNPIPKTITTFGVSDRGGQTVTTKPNPNYLPSYTQDDARNQKLLGDIDPTSIKTRADFDAATEKNKHFFFSPITYQADRGGAASGGVPYYDSLQKAANSNELYQIGIAKGYIDPNAGDLHGLAKIVGDVVKGVVIAGIAWGGSLAVSQAAGGTAAASAAPSGAAASSPTAGSAGIGGYSGAASTNALPGAVSGVSNAVSVVKSGLGVAGLVKALTGSSKAQTGASGPQAVVQNSTPTADGLLDNFFSAGGSGSSESSGGSGFGGIDKRWWIAGGLLLALIIFIRR